VKAFFDSSAFIKRYVEENGSQAVDDICRESSSLGLSVICAPEIISALNRRRRKKLISPGNYSLIKQALSEDIREATIINLTSEVIAKTTALLEKNSLRAMDAIHVACAMTWPADLFVSADMRQINAAKHAGLKTVYV
jgi:predicted nucleic acid-binding protein